MCVCAQCMLITVNEKRGYVFEREQRGECGTFGERKRKG